VKEFFNGHFTWIGPSSESRKRIYAKCAGIIDSHRPQKRRNAQYRHQRAEGKASPEAILIYRMNPVLRGWALYHRPHNAKKVFSHLDHQIWRKLFRHQIKTHPAMARKRIVEAFFNGGNPWIFKTPGTRGKAVELLKTSSIRIKRHFPVQRDRSYFDGDWAYWGTRTGRYPSIPRAIGTCLKRQKGRCCCCETRITKDRRVIVVRDVDPEGSRRWRLVHNECVDPTRDAKVRL
jgi:RNA-directed DNA polymerase